MVSETSIVNRALRLLKVETISALSEDSEAGSWANDTYEPARDALLAEYPWNFAIARASLAAAVATPTWGPTKFYELPADCLRVLNVEGEPETLGIEDWWVEGRRIATDGTAPLKIRYIAKVTDPAQWSPLFIDALVARLAAEAAYRFTGSTSREAQLTDRYREVIANARRYDAQEGTPQGLVADQWLKSRL